MTRGALPVVQTEAGVRVAEVLTRAAVTTRGAVAVTVLEVARLALPATFARAHEVCKLVRTRAVVATRVGLTLVDVCNTTQRKSRSHVTRHVYVLTYLTDGALPAFLANALVRVHLVHARAAVHARVQLAVVDVCNNNKTRCQDTCRNATRVIHSLSWQYWPV